LIYPIDKTFWSLDILSNHIKKANLTWFCHKQVVGISNGKNSGSLTIKVSLLTQTKKRFRHKIMYWKVLSKDLVEIFSKGRTFCQYLCQLMLLVMTQTYQDCVIPTVMVLYFYKRHQRCQIRSKDWKKSCHLPSQQQSFISEWISHSIQYWVKLISR